MQDVEKKEIPEELWVFLLELKEATEKYGSTATSLAKKAGVDPKAIRKILNLGYTKFPNTDIVLKILAVLSGERNPVEIAKHYGGAIYKFLEKNLHIYFSGALDPSNIEVETISAIKDFASYQIIRICDTEKGEEYKNLIKTISILMLKKSDYYSAEENDMSEHTAFKELAKNHIDRLIDKGVLQLSSDKRVSTKAKNIQIPFNLTHEYFGDTILFCDPSRWEIDDYFSRIKFGACSNEEARTCVLEMFQCYQKISKIIDKSEKHETTLQVISSVEEMRFRI